MKIYIFGAGASLGSQKDKYSKDSLVRAPLVNELFDPRYGESALYMLTPEELSEFREEIERQPNRSVEEWLGERWNRIESIPSRARKESEKKLFGHIVLYIWNVLRRVSDTYAIDNVYRLFLKNLEHEDFGLISFNYDTLLDRAYEEIFHKIFIHLDDYIGENFVKPHGSVNWLLEKRDTDRMVPPNNDISLRIGLAMQQFFTNGVHNMDKIRVLRPTIEALRNGDVAEVWRILGMDYFYPLIFIPIAQKQLDHVAVFQERIIEKGKEMMRTAEEIYVIGYRAKDDIARELIKCAPDGTPIHVVSDQGAKVISDDILAWAKNLTKGSWIDGGFASFNEVHFRKPGQFYG